MNFKHKTQIVNFPKGIPWNKLQTSNYVSHFTLQISRFMPHVSRFTFYILYFTLFSLLLLNSCSLNRFVMNSASSFIEDGVLAVYEEEDLELAEQFLASNLKTIEILLTKDPDNTRLNLLAAQGFGAYAMAFIEDNDPERASRFYLRGLKYSFRALPKKKRFNKKITPADLEKLLPSYNKNDVPALFWLGYNWGSYVMHHLNDPKELINLSKVEMLMRRVLELDEKYNFAGVHLFYATFYAARPPILGGNPELGRKHFLKNMELNNNKFLMTKVYYARYYAFQVQDKELFDQLLKEVLEADLDKYPEVRLMNEIAKRKALQLKKEEDLHWFPKD